MALFLRGNVWWYEIRTAKIRIVKSTGFRKPDKKKAEAAYAACKLGVTTKVKRSAMESMLEAIYSERKHKTEFPIGSIWQVYTDWIRGKSKVISAKTLGVRKTSVDMFEAFCSGRGLTDMSDASVQVARQFVGTLAGKSNKTIRNRVQDLSTVWEAVGQIHPGVFNPWKAACPDNDGSSRRRDDFSANERERILAACREIGHDWYGVSLVACYTGLRYGDVAMLEWSSINLEEGTIRVTPSKTKRHGVRVVLPIAAPVRELLQSSTVPRDGFVFPEHGINYKQNLKMRPAYSEVLKMAGIEGYHDFHSWRHTFRSMLAAAGVSDDIARRMGGWTNLTMAAHYDHDSHLSEMRAAVNAITSTKT